MILLNVKTDRCPICGCSEVVREEVKYFDGKISTHQNGGRWESRKFACGYSTQYVPNFNHETCTSSCKGNQKKEVEDFNTTIMKLHKYLDEMDCSDKIKSEIKQTLKEKHYLF